MDNFEKMAYGWIQLGQSQGNVYYQKLLLAKMVENKNTATKINYNSCHIAVARNGGPVAFVKKSKHLLMDVTNPIKDSVRIFSFDGRLLNTIKFEEKTIVGFEFSYDERLYAILHDGKIFKFDLTLNITPRYLDSGTCFYDDPIYDARLFENGFVCMTQSSNFYIVNSMKQPSATLFASAKDFFENTFPSDYLFIPMNNSRSGRVELIVPHNTNGILLYEDGNSTPKYMKNSSLINLTSKNLIKDSFSNDDLGLIKNILISPKNEMIGLYADNGNIFVFDSDFKENSRKVSQTKLLLKPPYQINWCAEDCVVITMGTSIILVGPDNCLQKINLNLKQTYSGSHQNVLPPNLFIYPEIDGIRIINDENCELLQKVKDELFNSIFYMSVDPAKKLLEAYIFANEKKPNCDYEIRKIRNELPEAVKTLLIAATTQFEIENQLFFMKAAQHGKTFLNYNEFNFAEFVEICKDLRILNNLRTTDVPRYMTYDQYKILTHKQVVKLLMKYNNFYLAHEISGFLKLKVRKVYEKWAIAKIKGASQLISTNEEIDLYNEIQKKLSETQGISYIKLSKKAFKFKKEEIGIKFLENEKSILTKIPQYLELLKWDKALELAIETHDSNVIYTVVDKIMTTEPMDSFLTIVAKYRKAEPVIIAYLKANHESIIDDYFKIIKNWEALIFFNLEKYFKSNNLENRRLSLIKCKDYIKPLLVGEQKEDWKFYKTFIEDELEKGIYLKRDLLKEDHIKQTDMSNFDSPTFDVYYNLIKNEKVGLVEIKNKQYFGINLKKIFIIRLRVYGSLKNTDAIKSLNGIKNSPLTYLNFAEACIDNDLRDIAVEFIKKIQEEDYFEYKIVMLKHIEKYVDALEIIVANRKFEKKREYIENILIKAPDLQYKVDELCVKYKVQI